MEFQQFPRCLYTAQSLSSSYYYLWAAVPAFISSVLHLDSGFIAVEQDVNEVQYYIILPLVHFMEKRI